MPKRVLLAAAVLAALAATAACEKTDSPAASVGPFRFTPFQWEGAIPAAYGRLVAVTTSPAHPEWAQLWFEKPDSTIVTVFVNYQTGSVRDKILEIPRS